MVVVVAWTYDFFNGMNDAANAIATTVSTRALTPRQAILLARTMNFLGAFLTTEVARTIGKGIVAPEALTQTIVLTGVAGRRPGRASARASGSRSASRTRSSRA